MLRAHAVVNAVEPSLQITEDEVDDRHELLGQLGVAAFGNGVMVISLLPQATVAAPVVGDDQRPRHNGALDESPQGTGAAVGSDGDPSHKTEAVNRRYAIVREDDIALGELAQAPRTTSGTGAGKVRRYAKNGAR